MGKVSRAEARRILREDDPDLQSADLEMYLDQWMTYVEAVENIQRVGSVAKHPRTDSPITNPYLQIRDQAQAAMSRMKRVRETNRLFEFWRERIEAE